MKWKHTEEKLMNIAVQCCGIAVLAILLLFYIQKKTLITRTVIIFKHAFWMIACCLCLDILSIVAITNRDSLSPGLVNVACKLYLMSLVVSILCSLLYVCSDIWQDEKRWRLCVLGYSLFTLMDLIGIGVARIFIYYDIETKVIYSYGPAVWVTYAGGIIMILNNIILLFTQKKINPGRRRAVMIWMAMWICAANVQLFDKKLLIIGFAAAMGILVVYLQFENPESNLDQETGFFNQGAFMMYMQHMYRQKRELPVMSVGVYRYSDGEQQKNAQEHAVRQMADILLAIPNIYVFRVNEAELLILFRKKEGAAVAAEDICRKLQSEFRLYGDNAFKPYYIYMENMQIVDSGSELLELMYYVRTKNNESAQGKYMVIDEQTAGQMFHIKNMEHQITEALEQDRIVVFYQPIYSVKEQRFTSAEALVRMIDDEGKMIMPGDFIQIAEENGMIRKIGMRVFEKVCRFFIEQDLEQYGIQYIEVNLSTVQGADENLAGDYIRIMDKQHIEPEHINLEITESASVSARNVLLDNMKELMERGVHFSLDDFGTGQSNLNYIVEMPVHIVKFDRGMINAYFENGKARYVMDAAMHMIQGMDLDIVAEGVETEVQFETMKELGIQYIQGYYFSKPLSEQHFLDFIREKNADETGGVA